MPTFIALQGPDKGRTLKTEDETIVIGRGSDQIPLTDHTVSRRHAELRASDGGWLLADLHSTNGTWINGVRVVKPVRLKHGDQIRVGSTLLVYTGDETVEQLSGQNIPRDLVTLDVGGMHVDSEIIASLPSNEDSVVMAAPETAYAVKSWNIIRQLSDVIGSLLPADQLLARVLDIIVENVDVDRGVVFLRDEQTGELLPEVVRFHGRKSKEAAPVENIMTSRTILNHVVNSREGILCTNVVGDRRFQNERSVQNLGMRSVICAPIVAREQVLGVIHLDTPPTRHTYNEHELRLITAIGYQTGLAIENSRLVRSHVERERLAAAGETVAYLSHYIKNILQGVRSGGEVLRRGLERRDFATTEQGWSIVERNVEKAYNLMANMLAFSKEREPRLEMLQVNRIVDEVIESVQKIADDGGIVLLSDLDGTAPAIPLDYDGIYQVILNLVTNALDAVPRGSGRINVRTRYHSESKEVVISVVDNGPGVPPDVRQRIFNPFFSTKGQRGTGLGLAVARKIVEEMGGQIDLRNPADGGAEFLVRCPSVNPRMNTAGDTFGPRK